MNVLSLFDGMSCGQIALKKAGIKIDNYYSSEIDKHAIQITQKNFPNTIQLGDVRNVFSKNLPKIDLLIGGSPCQGFSFAGKRLNFDDPRSILFFEFVRLKNECNPTYFLLENVKMEQEHEKIINKYIGTNPIEIDSALVSAQNRLRLYWTNINEKPFGLFGDLKSEIQLPKDKKLFLKDILESEVDEKYYISEKRLKLILDGQSFGQSNTVLNGFEKSTCLSAAMGMGGGYVPYIRKEITPYQGDKIHYQYEKMQCLSAQGGNNLKGIGYSDGNRIRKLTPIECERLQTVPDNYTDGVSDTQRYKMLGNGWTVDIIAHILSFIKKN